MAALHAARRRRLAVRLLVQVAAARQPDGRVCEHGGVLRVDVDVLLLLELGQRRDAARHVAGRRRYSGAGISREARVSVRLFVLRLSLDNDVSFGKWKQNPVKALFGMLRQSGVCVALNYSGDGPPICSAILSSRKYHVNPWFRQIYWVLGRLNVPRHSATTLTRVKSFLRAATCLETAVWRTSIDTKSCSPDSISDWDQCKGRQRWGMDRSIGRQQ